MSQGASLSGLFRRVAPAVWLAVAGLCFVSSAPAAVIIDAEMERTFKAFYEMDLDSTRAVPVAGLKIQRDGLQLDLASGHLWLSKPLEGRITGAYFIGDGTATITANGLVGRNMLRATLSGKNAGVPFPGQLPQASILRPAIGEKAFDRLEVKIEQAHFRFSDGLETELLPLLKEGTGGEVAAAEAEFDDRNGKLYYLDEGTLELDLILQQTNGLEEFGFFVAEMKVGNEWILYANRGSLPQEIWVGTHPGIGGVQQRLFTWTAFDRKEDYDQGGRWDTDILLDQKDLLDITNNVMRVDIPNTLAFRIDARISFTPLVETLTVARFDLINNYGYPWYEAGGHPVRVESVTDEAGTELPFIHKRDQILVRLTQPLELGEEKTLRFVAEEETIIQNDPESWNIVNTYAWFPQHGFSGGLYPTDWTISIKKPLSVIASGKLTETREEGGQTITRWVMEKEVKSPSLVFGRYQALEDVYESIADGRKITVGVHAHPSGELRGTTKSKSVMEEVKTILKLYEELFSPFLYDRLDVTQMSVGFPYSQAPPGILFLTGEAFLPTGLVAASTSGRAPAPYYHDLFAHELGHQWWGHNLVWGRFEDQWLSEAFTEYASGLYALQLSGQQKFMDKLKEWRDKARDAEGSGFPIAAGNMVTAKDPSVQSKYRNGLIYEKGAYVVHMLRMTLGHDKFIEAMKKLNTDYAGQMIATRDVEQVVEEVAGGSMDWFFNQWFYGTGIPSFRFSYTTRKAEDGSGFILTGKIVQDEELGVKQVLMPVFYDLGGKEPAVKNVVVQKPMTEFQAKLPSQPKRVWLDEFRSVLGEVVTEAR
jgi:hypothetical protein